jgi:hypothetical protein
LNSNDKINDIVRLNDLVHSKIISNEEYDILKQQILNKESRSPNKNKIWKTILLFFSLGLVSIFIIAIVSEPDIPNDSSSNIDSLKYALFSLFKLSDNKANSEKKQNPVIEDKTLKSSNLPNINSFRNKLLRQSPYQIEKELGPPDVQGIMGYCAYSEYRFIIYYNRVTDDGVSSKHLVLTIDTRYNIDKVLALNDGDKVFCEFNKDCWDWDAYIIVRKSGITGNSKNFTIKKVLPELKYSSEQETDFSGSD